METIENNKLIAKFIGDKKFWLMLEGLEGIYPNFNGTYYQSGDDRTIDNPLKEEYVFEFKACFHDDWNWLMPVINKCREESNTEDSHWEAIYYSLEGCDIDEVYNAVVEFIKWYNEEN